MAKAKIFIASSLRVLNLAKHLRSALSTDFSDPVIWIEESRNVGSQTIIEMLEEAAKTYDFAVIILTRDDQIFKKGLKGKEQIKARDNCIFEAGLFFGTKGRDNCYILSSVPKEDLPADLGGIIYKHFEEPKDFANLATCREAIEKQALEIITGIQTKWLNSDQEKLSKTPTRFFPVVSREQMFEWETCEAGGRIEKDRAIVVTATQQY